MTADFRALCVELTDCLEKADWPHKQKHVFQQWTYIARKALAEPEPEGPTDEEIDEMAWNWYSKTGSTWYQIESFRAFARAVLARWGTPNLTETRRSLTDAWAAHQPAIEAAAKAGMDACRQQPSDHLYVRFASLEWKLGCHMAEWKAARALAYRMGKAGDELNQAHCDGVVRLLREHLDLL